MDPAEDLGNTKVGDLQMTLVGQQKVLQLDIAVGNPILVEIRNTTQKLFEETEFTFKVHITLLHKCKEFSLGAVFHDVIPTTVVGAEHDRFDDIRVVETFGDTELRLHFLFVLCLLFLLAAFAEFFHGELLIL